MPCTCYLSFPLPPANARLRSVTRHLCAHVFNPVRTLRRVSFPPFWKLHRVPPRQGRAAPPLVMFPRSNDSLVPYSSNQCRPPLSLKDGLPPGHDLYPPPFFYLPLLPPPLQRAQTPAERARCAALLSSDCAQQTDPQGLGWQEHLFLCKRNPLPMYGFLWMRPSHQFVR